MRCKGELERAANARVVPGRMSARAVIAAEPSSPLTSARRSSIETSWRSSHCRSRCMHVANPRQSEAKVTDGR